MPYNVGDRVRYWQMFDRDAPGGGESIGFIIGLATSMHEGQPQYYVIANIHTNEQMPCPEDAIVGKVEPHVYV